MYSKSEQSLEGLYGTAVYFSAKVKSPQAKLCDAWWCRESILVRRCGGRKGNHSGVSKSFERRAGEVCIRICHFATPQVKVKWISPSLTGMRVRGSAERDCKR